MRLNSINKFVRFKYFEKMFGFVSSCDVGKGMRPPLEGESDVICD